ncbi:hypothetical protein B0J13DRAFT_566966 [Dactylonectria estremocensis]|uniref:Peptidase S8/S53 domain-containing protein n=1 Tax=Dactylonectria estremocensis TaxID=1079267 RepID=A0A9P9DP73_9HYPO|nr:hypothetical protein B0J13DRAFT_566966 [Dactylonectria estremocensis]
MRVCDLAEWRVVRALQPYLVTATESTLQSLATDDPSNILRDTLDFLLYELGGFETAIPTHRDLGDDSISLFKSEIRKVLPVLDKLLSIDLFRLLERLAEQSQQQEHLELIQQGSLDLDIVLLDRELCSSVVLALESFNTCMETHFRAGLRLSTPFVDQCLAPAGTKFDFNHKGPIETFLSAVKRDLVECKSQAQHQVVLQLAGQKWQTIHRGSKSLYLSGCGTPKGWQEIEYLAFDVKNANPNDVRCSKLHNLCAAIADYLCFNRPLRLQAKEQGLYIIGSARHRTQGQNGVPVLSIATLLGNNHFRPLSFESLTSTGFTVSEKRELTLNLAWCLIHLFNCKWTDKAWSCDKIFLLESSNVDRNEILRNVPPYMECEQTEMPANEHSIQESLLGDSVFLRFAKLLVEIEIGERIVATERNNHGQASMWLTIDKIAEDGTPSAGDSYLKAIEGCLDLHREAYQSDHSDRATELKRMIYEDVVLPLEKDHSHYRRPNLKRQRSQSRENSRHELEEPRTLSATDPFSTAISPAYCRGVDEDEECVDDSSGFQQATDGGNCGQDAKRPRLQFSLHSDQPSENQFSVDQPPDDQNRKVRRSTRIATRVKSVTKTALSSVTSVSSKTKLKLSKDKSSTSVGSLTVEIFDDVAEESYDGRVMSISKRFFNAIDGFLESYLPDRSEYCYRAKDDDRRSSRRVRVCVIDTGLDMTHPSVVAAKSDHRLKETKSWLGDMADTYGHGTHAADLILRVAPEAELYVAKVAEGKFMPEKDIPLIVEAIDWAISQDVDIISMSFGLDKRNDSLDKAVNKAVAAGKILLAAAGNNGNNNPRAFPATNRHVICIHASDGKGKDGKISPQALENDDNFMTLGIAVPLTWKSNQVFMSGTSFSTPIAAAIAADVLEISKSMPMTPEQQDRLYSCDGMRKIFMLLSPGVDGRYRYVVPWGLWNSGRTEAIIRESILEQLDC